MWFRVIGGQKPALVSSAQLERMWGGPCRDDGEEDGNRLGNTRLLQKEQYDSFFSVIDLKIYEEMSRIE